MNNRCNRNWSLIKLPDNKNYWYDYSCVEMKNLPGNFTNTFHWLSNLRHECDQYAIHDEGDVSAIVNDTQREGLKHLLPIDPVWEPKLLQRSFSLHADLSFGKI